MSVNLAAARYVPTIFLRGAELLAVKELPSAAKDLLVPIFCLKPWKTAKLLQSAMQQIENAFPDRQYFLDIDPFIRIDEIKRPAQEQFLSIIDDENGNQNWVEFFENYPNAYPCIIAKHGNVNAVGHQIAAFTAAEKTFLLRLEFANTGDPIPLIQRVCATEHSNFGIVLDVGWGRDLIAREGWADNLIKQIVAQRGDDIPIILSGSSFPSSFEGIGVGDTIQATERPLFERLRAANNQAQLIFGDWASSRSPTERSGGAPIPPRIEVATARGWEVFRVRNTDGGFQVAAAAAVRSPNFHLGGDIWANYVIRATAERATNGISSLFVAAAARINLHLYRQLYFDLGMPPLNTDEDYIE